ncbi:MAG: DUF1385 domain-containing protein [Lachnospira sp.]|nr:DUF1385 domain-containing protein [Lachnospira sp.]
MKTSGIGGQAVIEGIMMRNKDKYAIAVRKPDNEIELSVRESRLLTEKYKWLNFPVIRGVFNFVDSLVTGVSTITYSASFYDDPAEQKKTKADEIGKAIFKDKLESVLMAVTIIISVALAVGLFMVVPYFVSRLLAGVVTSQFLLNFLEGIVRVVIFLLYLVAISHMNDIKRTFMYHGAEHKCINCIEHGAPLTVDNVMNSSRLHKRCGTSFMFLVMFISIIFFIFIRVDNTILQLVIRLLLIPVIAGVSYEVLRWAGRSDNAFINVISKPGLWMQKLTTREPDRDMAEVAIAAVEAVFDWRAFLDEYYADLEGEEARNEAVKASEQALADEAAARGYNKIKEQVELNATSADSETRKIKPSEQTEAVAKAAAHVSSDEGIKIEEPEIPSEVSSVNVSDAGINESEDGIELEDDIESEDGEQIEDDTQTEDSLPDEDVQDTEEDELCGIEIEEPQESGEEIENADDVPIFKKRDSE